MNKTNLKLMIESGICSVIINLAISAIWFVFEYLQFNELQFNRDCDTVVSFIYFCIIWHAIYKSKKGGK